MTTAATGERSGKICAICGADCSNRPRVKDQMGRYFCEGCYEQALQRKHAALAETPDAPESFEAIIEEADAQAAEAAQLIGEQADALAALGSGEIAGQCPACGVHVPAGAIVCTACGYNVEIRQATRIEVKDWKKDTRRVAVATSPGGLGWAAAGFWTALCLFAVSREAFETSYVWAFAIATVGIGIWVAYEAFRCGILNGVLAVFFPPYGLWFLFTANANRHLRAVAVAQFFGAALLALVIIEHNTDWLGIADWPRPPWIRGGVDPNQ